MSAKVKAMAIVMAASLVVIITFSYYGETTFRRFRSLYHQYETADMAIGSGRWALYQGAMAQFMENPILGSSLEMQGRQSYPHNHIVEAFMATGAIGGLAFVMLAAVALYAAFMILKHLPERGWIACFFLVLFLRGFFSSVVIDAQLWYSLIAVLGVWFGFDPKSMAGEESRTVSRRALRQESEKFI